jgi:hypothetical protein
MSFSLIIPSRSTYNIACLQAIETRPNSLARVMCGHLRRKGGWRRSARL